MSAFRETVIASPSGAFHTLFRCSEGVTTTVAKYKRLKGKVAAYVGTSEVRRSSMIRQTARIRSARSVGVSSATRGSDTQLLKFRQLFWSGWYADGFSAGGPGELCEPAGRRSTTAGGEMKYIAMLSLTAVALCAQAQTDYSKVEIKTTKVGANFYTLEGSGGMIGVLVGPDGVLMVDSQFAPLTDKIVAAVRQISDRPIRFLVNTHVHPDHTGGNENLGKMGVVILAREELRARLKVPPAGLPLLTYQGPLTLHMNGEDVELIPVPKAHTDGDTMVYFPGVDVIMTGDFYRSIQYPNIDRANGGSLPGILDGLGVVIGMAGPNTKIIPGHGPTVDRTAVTAHRDMILVIRDRVAKLIAQGKTAEEVTAAKPTADYDSKIQQIGTTGDRFVGQLYAELKK
jgi:cyclase